MKWIAWIALILGVVVGRVAASLFGEDIVSLISGGMLLLLSAIYVVQERHRRRIKY